MQIDDTPLAAAGRDAPVTVTCPTVGADTVAPVQVVLGLAPAGTTTPAGRLSVADRLVTARASGLMKVMRRRERVPGLITAGVNTLVTPMFAPADRLVVVDSVFEMPWAEVTAPIGIRFCTVPVVCRVTLTETVQLAAATIDAPLSDRLVPPAVPVAMPPGQVVVALGVGAITMPVSAPPARPLTVK